MAENRILQSCTVRYVLKGDDPEKDKVEIPAFSVTHMTREDGKLKGKAAEIYVDSSPVFARLQAKAEQAEP